jgi:chromosome segregation ATPase
MTETESKRRIGDILLELGFVTPEALAKASAEQEESGQPLGQILVEHGAITRLELASALAEQWADHASITPLPVPSAMPRVAPQPHDEDQYAARLQEAVIELAQRVETAVPQEAVPDGRLTDLAERIEATVARTQRLEATLATLAESLDGVTGGVEEAFAVLQSGMAGLALDLARIDTTIAELQAEPAVTPTDTTGLEQQVEELRAAVHQLAERPPADEDARRRADELAAEVQRLADDTGIESLREALGAVERRVDTLAEESGAASEIDAQRALLHELRATVSELQERPAGDPALDARLARVEEDLAAAPRDVPAASDVAALADRLEKTRDNQKELGRSIESLASRLDEVALREPVDAASAAEVDELRARLASLASELEHVRETVPSARVAELAGELERLAAGDGLRSLETRLHDLETSLPEGYVTQAGLSELLERVREELTPAPAEPDPRIEALAHDLDALRDELARVEQLEGRLGGGLVTPDDLSRALEASREELALEDTQARAELAALAGRLERLVTHDDLDRAVAGARAHGGDAAPVPDPRVDRLASDLDALRSEIADMAPAAAADPHADGRLSALSARLEELTLAQRDREALAHDLDALRGQLGAVVTREELDGALAQARSDLAAARVPAPSEPDARVAQLAADLDAVRDHLRRVEQGPHLATADALERLAEKLATLEARPEPVVELPPPADTSHLDAAVAELQARLAGLEPLRERIDELSGALATSAPADPGPLDELRAELDARLGDLSRALDERLESVPATSSGPSGGVDGVEDELERTRMAIERLSLHLGEHDRALAEMRGSRAMTQRLEELAARLEETAANGPPAAGAAPTGESSYARRSLEPDIEMRSIMRRLEDLEEAASVGREKLMNRLERIASSIDWRLQRLESADLTREESQV